MVDVKQGDHVSVAGIIDDDFFESYGTSAHAGL